MNIIIVVLKHNDENEVIDEVDGDIRVQVMLENDEIEVMVLIEVRYQLFM